MDVNVTPFEIETKTRHGDMVRADVYLPRNGTGPFPVLLGASPYQKALRHLPPIPATFPFIEYGPMQLYLDEGYAYVAMDTPGMGRSDGVWDPVSCTEGEAIHDMIEHVAGLDWSTGKIGMIGMSHYCWSQWNAARTLPPRRRCRISPDHSTEGDRIPLYKLARTFRMRRSGIVPSPARWNFCGLCDIQFGEFVIAPSLQRIPKSRKR